jgi:LysM repeat protein
LTRFRAGALGALLLLVSLLAANAPAALADEGSATWYGQPYHGRRMANGQVFDMYDPTTTACNIYPMGTWIRVTNPANGRSVTVQVRDRGGFSHALDLSYAAFMAIAEPGKMRINVQYEVVSGPDGEPVAAPAPQPEPVPEEPAPPPAAEPVADSGGAVHTVQPGETLGDIAAAYGASVEDLVAWNGLEDPDLLVPGQELVVSAAGAASDSAAAPSPPRPACTWCRKATCCGASPTTTASRPAR